MHSIIYLVALFIAKVIDNAINTTKTIMIQRSRWVLAGIAVILSDFIYFWIMRNVVTSDRVLTMLIVAVAGGVGCSLACFMNDKLSKDRTYVNVIMSDNLEAMKKLRDFLAEHHITNVATNSYTLDWNTKTITIAASAKATAAMVKAIIAGLKSLVAAIAAGGWVAVAVIVVICVIALVMGSCFGIFFSSEENGSNQTMYEVVREINEEYQEKLEEIKTNNPYDELEMSGSRAVWPEVLSVYAVKMTTDPNNPQEVATVTDEKKEILKEIFWEMNQIDYDSSTRTVTRIVETDDGNGNILEEEVEETVTTLRIVVSHKTADEMAQEYGFNADQREQLIILLDTENNSLWSNVLYGVYDADDQIVAVAASQLGNVGGQPYWSWYGFGSRVEWCACFVSWCANECGYIDVGVIPKFALCSWGAQWFKDRGQWGDNSMEPTPGTIIFFDWDGDRDPDHVGIVEYTESGVVHTIEGNSGDACGQRQYSVGNNQTYGYGLPAY